LRAYGPGLRCCCGEARDSTAGIVCNDPSFAARKDGSTQDAGTPSAVHCLRPLRDWSEAELEAKITVLISKPALVAAE
jgi:hypothetical protein